MIEKIMKAVKSSNKRRGRNITIGTVIGFLLSCTAVMGEDNYLWIGKNNGAIQFNKTATTDDDGKWEKGNPYSNNNWDTVKKTYTNNIKLLSNEVNGEYGMSLSYGLRLSGNLTNVNFVNNNSITGKVSSGSGDGYGIYNSAEMGNIKNAGEISGSGISGGCGIENKSGTIGGITNTGEISGSGIGNSNATGNGFGYGIYNSATSVTSATMGNIENKGVISGTGSGTSLGKGYGYGIYNSATMKNITNTGIISGTGIGDSSYSGEGYGIKNILGTMGNITNTGLISGTGIGTSSSGDGEGYGINNYSTSTMGKITNTGVISGIGKDSSGNNKGYGINNGAGTIGDITNAGVISGIGTTTGTGIHNESYDKEMGKITNTGIISGTDYGIYNGSSSTMGAITNTGVIYGKDNAIKNDKDIQNNTGTITATNNYGILVTKGNSEVDGLALSNNYGLIIKNEGKNPSDISEGTAGTQDIAMEYAEDGKVIKSRSMTIKNETGSNSFDGNKENHILNALTNTYKVTGENDKVTGSIINAYGTAVVFGDTGNNNQLTLSGTIVNGGIDGSAAILGSDDTDNGDNLILQSGKIKYKDGSEVIQNTVVNGNIDMGAGADTLTVGDGTIINGTLDGGDGDDTLNFGISSGAKSNSSEREGVRILHNITGFENMNINTNVTLFEKTIEDGEETDLKVTGATEIKIGENGTLTLRINSSKMGSGDEADKIVGHALHGNTGEISSTDGGKLLLALNGAGNENIISFGSTTLGDGLVTGNGGTLDTTSALHTLERIDNKDVKVIVKQDIPDFFEIPEYEKLNKIYHGILSVEDLIANFNVDDESLSIFLGYLNDIYAGNPYSYSSELSRKSVGMFRDIATESQFKPELNKWLIMGGLTHVDGGTKDTYYGKGYYTYDVGSSDMDADTKITGAYMLGEYGVSDTLTYGVVIGGNKLKSELSNGSKVDGDALYMGAYAKKYVGNLKVTGGLGLQYGDYDADRIAINKVASSLAEPVMKYCDNYNDMTYDIYLNGRYSHHIGNNLFLEPYGTLSYTYIKQDSTDEGSKVLAIETDSKSFDYTAAKVGVDLKKVIPHEKGKSTLSAGVSYTRLLTGADEENITGRFKGGSDFDILVAHKNEHSIGLNAKYALELENGILFDVKGSYSVERDSHNGSGKNRAKGEWIVGVGIGYKF
ncbi:autotransporter domain-containing protein [Fusobacterium varium]|uniref:autotransporter domain-containing protein n=1 Tax=Fusobacterium varium TaxID=856 RepID=UPI002FF3F1F3